MRHFSRLLSGITAAALGVAAILPLSAQAAGLSFQELREKFPDKKYWDTTDPNVNDPDTWTDTPCSHGADGKTYCLEIVDGYWSGYQCFGFAMKLTYDIYGQSFVYWEQDDDLSTIKAGDCLRINNDNHSIVIQKVEGENVWYVDCNYGYTCQINWDHKTTRSSLKKSLTYIAHAPYEAPQTPVTKALGDVDGSGEVDASDAAMVLVEAALLGSGGTGTFGASVKSAADTDGSGKIDASDAALILMYAAAKGAGEQPDWAKL